MSSFDNYINERVKKGIQEFDMTLSTVIDKLSPEGWTLPASLNIYAVNVIGQTDEIQDINEFLKWHFTHDEYSVLKDIMDKIQNSEIRDGLKKVIDECWCAFQINMFAVCSSSLVLVIEGLLSDFSDNKNNTNMKKVCNYKVEHLPEDCDKIEKYLWISYNRFIENLYEHSDFSSNEPNKINRHWLLHGRSEFDFDELDCIRLFNAIDTICMAIEKVNTN